MRYASTITSKGTITLPAELRAQLGLKAGERVGIDLDPTTQRIVIKKSPTLEEVRAMNRQRMAERGIKPGIDAHTVYSDAVREKYGRH
jgi:AbrB family looped-hinge helix DNA binding protein